MLTRLTQKRNARSDGGFTLIELLVVVIIIAILAGIAIPMYLRQREKGWEANAISDLRNAAVAQESYYTGSNPSSYTTLLGDLTDEGFNQSSQVTLTPVSGDENGYCMQAIHNSDDSTFRMLSSIGEPEELACP